MSKLQEKLNEPYILFTYQDILNILQGMDSEWDEKTDDEKLEDLEFHRKYLNSEDTIKDDVWGQILDF